jgi:heme A synthase
MGLLLMGQLTLGVLTVLTAKVPVIASVHVATGAALLGLATLLALRSCRLSLRAHGGEDAQNALRSIST